MVNFGVLHNERDFLVENLEVFLDLVMATSASKRTFPGNYHTEGVNRLVLASELFIFLEIRPGEVTPSDRI